MKTLGIKTIAYQVCLIAILGLVNPSLYANDDEDDDDETPDSWEDSLSDAQQGAEEITDGEQIQTPVPAKSFSNASQSKPLSAKDRRALKQEEKKAKSAARKAMDQTAGGVHKNKNFFGDVKKAKNATPQELSLYDRIFSVLDQLLAKKEISNTSYEEASKLITALKVWHTHNRSISNELNNTASNTRGPHSNTYESAFRREYPGEEAPSLHIENNGINIPFEAKPDFLLKSFLKALQFAQEFGMAGQLFEALTGVGGCLENHFGAPTLWMLETMDRLSKGKSAQSGTDAIRAMLALDYENGNAEDPLEERVLRTAAGYFKCLPEDFDPKDRDDAKRLEFVRRIIVQAEGSSVSLFPTPERHKKRKSQPFQSSKSSKMGKKALVKIKDSDEPFAIYEVDDDGDCGWSALDMASLNSLGISRADFIARINASTGALRARIMYILRNSDINFQQWLAALNGNLWMGEVEFAVLAEVYNVAIRILVLNAEGDLVPYHGQGVIHDVDGVEALLNIVHQGPNGARNHFNALLPAPNVRVHRYGGVIRTLDFSILETDNDTSSGNSSNASSTASSAASSYNDDTDMEETEVISAGVSQMSISSLLSLSITSPTQAQAIRTLRIQIPAPQNNIQPGSK